MSGKYTSPFDELLASNQKQMDTVLGERSYTPPPRVEAPSISAAPPPAPVHNPSTGVGPAGKVLSGTVKGIPFQVKV